EYGPDSHELFDTYARADHELARLLAKLDASVGAGGYALVISADHGAGEAPEKLLSLGYDAGRIETSGGGGHRSKMGRDRLALERALDETLGKKLGDDERWIAHFGDGDLRFDRARLKAQGVELRAAGEAACAALIRQRGIAAAYTKEQLLEGRFAPNDRIARALRLSTHPLRSGDVMFALKPFWLATRLPASHGSPNLYDQRVPLLWMGPGVPRGRVVDAPATPADIAPTLAAMLRVEPPAGCEGRVLPEVLNRP
ncbi:MAG TPA: alkaline phosphatase family protein, partial [Planctomycetota bacterium]|nr:alkaline phosphatase family protein [Planctomycetota bacterium]